ncbi:MAG: glycosyltransferase family 4 protein [Spirochaetes bacterium]|nr:glycosyltransferase family 4 protein [Spirochaetota bacterium]
MSSVRWYNASANYALHLARGLKEAGITTVIFGIPGSPIIENAKDEGFTVIDDINLMDKNPLSYLKNIIKFKNLAAKYRFDIVNPHISRDHTFAFLSLGRKKYPIVRTRTDSIPPRNTIFNRCFYSISCSHIITSSGQSSSQIQNLGIAKNKISVIPQDLNFKQFADFIPRENLREKLNIPDKRIIVTFAGRLDKIKGVDYFVNSFPYLKERENIHFIISGEEINISIAALEQSAKRHDIRNITFMARINDIRELLSITDIGVIPSVGSEAICRIALEMLSFGIPIIGSNINSIPETIKEYGGILVDPGSSEEIASAIDFLASGDIYKKKKIEIKNIIGNRPPDKFLNDNLDIFFKQLNAQ